MRRQGATQLHATTYCSLRGQGAIESASQIAGTLKGQGATEYLVLLAVVLIIALVAIALLGFFPGMASDAQLAQTQAYWRSASPIAVVDGMMSTDQTTYDLPQVYLVLQNNGGETVQLLAVSGTTGSAEHFGLDDDGKKYQYFADVEGNKYSGYVSRFGGWYVGAEGYTEPIYLAPGERITVGFVPRIHWNSENSQNYPSSLKSVCGKENYLSYFGNILTPMGNHYVADLNIIYSVKIGGVEIIKKQVGSKPIMLPCTNSPPA